MFKFLIIFFCLVLSFPSTVNAQSVGDVTSQIENLGNPNKVRWPDSNINCRYARNPFDMNVLNNNIYLGSGNSANSGPCTNAGPVDLWYYNTLTNQFQKDVSTNSLCGANCLDDEQIEHIYNFGGKLYVPSKDPREGWEWGNVYIRDATAWTKFRTIPNAIHIYDIAMYGGKLFAGISTQDSANGSGIFISSNDGITWTPVTGYKLSPQTFFQFNNNFYAVLAFPNSQFITLSSISQYTAPASFNTVTNTNLSNLFPGNTVPLNQSAYMFRPINFGAYLVYMGAIAAGDQQPGDPFGLYKFNSLTSSGSNASKINLPGGAIPYDQFIGQDGKLYIAASLKNLDGSFKNSVFSTSDLTNFTEVLFFNYPSFVMAFEQFNGDFYFGIGTTLTDLSAVSGDLLRYKSVQSSPSAIKLGDIDTNGKVDIFDYNILLTDFGKASTGLRGDIDGNGRVDIFDYNLLLTNFGR